MTTIRASCPSCGDVQLKARDLSVRVCADTDEGSYAFRCPECGVAVAREASRRIIELLVSNGVHMDVWRLPAELDEPHYGPALCPDDLLDFHLHLQRDGWFEELVRSVEQSFDRHTD